MTDFALDAIDTQTGSTAGAELVVLGLNGKPLFNSKGEQHVLILLGPDSPQYRRQMHQQAAKRVRAAADAQERGEAYQPDLFEAEADAVSVLANLTKGWRGFLDRAGEPIECTPEAARALYARFPVIREQVDAFIVRRANFLPVSSKA